LQRLATTRREVGDSPDAPAAPADRSSAVTEFDFDLHEVGPVINAGVLVFPYERAGEIMRASRALMADAPDDLTIHEILITFPMHEPFPPHLQGRRPSLCRR
jgi:hypothetical protein